MCLSEGEISKKIGEGEAVKEIYREEGEEWKRSEYMGGGGGEGGWSRKRRMRV
jgi:hypothetical protein